MLASRDSQGIWFPQWAEVLARLRLPELRLKAYRQAVLAYLQFCKASRQRAAVPSARQFIAQVEQQRRLGASQVAIWKEALNWFFMAAKAANGVPPEPPSAASQSKTELVMAVPPLAATDLGDSEWEQRLIRELRCRAYQWRTEQTYRMWAQRFNRWLTGRRPGGNVMNAQETDIRDYLSELATRRRVSAATQRQALNALVFLLREALGRLLSDFGDFERARKLKRVPVVLSPGAVASFCD